MGCSSGTIDWFAYADVPNEVQGHMVQGVLTQGGHPPPALRDGHRPSAGGVLLDGPW